MSHFLVNGYKVQYKNGMADFTEFGILVRLAPSEFTHIWAIKMQFKLATLKDWGVL